MGTWNPNIDPSTEIAPGRKTTIKDWRALRASLNDGTSKEWEKAIAILRDRIENRFIGPIKHLQTKRYSGAAVMALVCLLIDTIQSFKEGRTSGGEDATAASFKAFLTQSNGFKKYFSSRQKASDFFSCVRCGLLHDGETRKNWKVRRDTKRVLEKVQGNWIVNPCLFASTLEADFDGYCDSLRKQISPDREPFLRRMDAICGWKEGNNQTLNYFAYGSNMCQARLFERVPRARFVCTARLTGYRLVFNKHSQDGSDKANIQRSESSEVRGCLYEMTADELDTFHRRFEKGYIREEVEARAEGSTGTKRAVALIAERICSKGCGPNASYVKYLVCGAHELGLSDYIPEIEDAAALRRDPRGIPV